MTLVEFLKTDLKRSLFPLVSPLVFVEHGEAKLRSFVYSSIFSPPGPASRNFAPAPIAYALKDSLHLRKLLVLDPVATFYLYDFVLRNSAAFQKGRAGSRTRYGYAFQGTTALPPAPQYHEFRRKKYQLKNQYAFFAKTDIANCFNSLYHHRVVQWVEKNVSVPESVQFGRFLRELNAGESVNCFPQGVHPAKTLGNFYLSFIESTGELTSPALTRFLDDTYFFSDSQAALERDVVVLQQILGGHSLCLNSSKTGFGSKRSDFDEHRLDDIKKKLLEKREGAVSGDADAADEAEVELDAAEIDYLKSLIKDPSVAEEDVELGLSLLREEEESFHELAVLVFASYPHLVKSLYRYLRSVGSGAELRAIISKRLREAFLTEFELFWIARMVIDKMKMSQDTVELLNVVLGHPCATSVVKAAILEVEENGFGLEDIKVKHLRDSPGNVVGMSALAGIRGLTKSKRNYLCGYVENTSQYMEVLADIVKSMP